MFFQEIVELNSETVFLILADTSEWQKAILPSGVNILKLSSSTWTKTTTKLECFPLRPFQGSSYIFE
jgi:hypothetical protein